MQAISAAESETGKFTLAYQADLLGNIRQILAGLKGYEPMVLELIQNADDSKSNKLTFDVDDDALRIANDSVFSDCGDRVAQICPWKTKDHRACDFHGISTVGSSAKMREADQIGRFGIGFVSVYQITDTPIIRSGTVELTLDPASASNAGREIPSVGGTEFELPWARLQTLTRDELLTSAVPADVCDLVLTALKAVTSTGLIFLRHLEHVVIRRSGTTVSEVRIDREEGQTSVEFSPGDQQRWLVLSADATEQAAALLERYPEGMTLKRRTDLSIAFPLHPSEGSGKIYAYLPTEQPSRLPAHINADFYPHQDRRKITLDGEGLDRFWNEMLLETAATCIADNMFLLRDALGYRRFWECLHSAYEARAAGTAFQVFWDALQPVAAVGDCVFTADADWVAPNAATLSYAAITSEEEKALSQAGLALVHSDLRSFHNTLAHLGAVQLGVSRLADELSEKAPARITQVDRIGELWAAAEKILSQASAAADAASRQRLQAVPFVTNRDGEFASPSELYSLPGEVDQAKAAELFPKLSLASSELAAFPNLNALTTPLDAEALANETVRALAVAGADSWIGPPQAHRPLYDLFGTLPVRDSAAVLHILRDAVFLRTGGGFTAPSKAQFPSDFSDPTGSMSILDAAAFSVRAERFVQETLKVPVLSFRRYVEGYLDGILRSGLSDDQYTALLRIMARHLADIASIDSAVLRGLPLVRTRNGADVSVREAYFKSDELVQVLGDDDRHWVDLRRIPMEIADLTKALFLRIGMTETPTARHILDRVAAITAAAPNDENRARINKVAAFLLERMTKFQPSELAVLAELKTMEWVPALTHGTRDYGAWHAPHEVYRFFRAEGFASQVAVVDLPPLRANLTAANEFMRFLEMGVEPATSQIVAHLEFCMNSGTEPKETVYQILSERLDRNEDTAAIARLRERAFIYASNSKEFLTADRVFWQKPAFGRYWIAASNRMHTMEKLFRFLGVRDEPTAESYCSLLRNLAEKHADGTAPDTHDQLIHDIALTRMAEFSQEDEGEAVAALETFPCLLSRARGFRFPSEVAWCDDEGPLELFGNDLTPFLVSLPSAKPELRELFARLGVRPLSQVTRRRIAGLSGGEDLSERTAELRARADLLLWLVPAGDFTRQLQHNLRSVEIKRVDELTLVGEFSLDEDPVISPVQSAAAYFDPETGILYVCCASDADFDWPVVLKALFADASAGPDSIDVKQLALNATLVVEARDHATARSRLVSVGLAPPANDIDVEIEAGAELADFDDSDLEPEPDPDEDSADEEEEGENEAERSTTQPTVRSDSSQTGAEPQKDRWGQEIPRGESDLPGTGTAPSRNPSPGQQRTEWMRSYVRPAARPLSPPGENRSDGGGDDTAQIDEAAMAAVLKYETSEGRIPERMSHTNPGYDVRSSGKVPSDTRYIEVKGLRGDWNGRGVKLSPTQFRTAEERSDRFWIYVVENATTADKRQIHPISNPFSLVDEYWFDDAWRAVSERTISNADLRLQPGAKVRHSAMGLGTIESVDRKIGSRIVVHFESFQKRAVVSSHEIEIVED